MMILIKQYFKTKILISTKLDKPICETRVPKLVFRTIPCLKFWALYSLHSVYIELPYIDEFWRCSVHTMYICNIKQWKFTKKNNSLYSYTDVVRLYVQSPNFHICTFCKHIRTVKNDPSRQKKNRKNSKIR